MKTVLAYVITFIMATVVCTVAIAALLAVIIAAICFMLWTTNVSITYPWLLFRGLLAIGAVLASLFIFSREGQQVIKSFKDGWDRA